MDEYASEPPTTLTCLDFLIAFTLLRKWREGLFYPLPTNSVSQEDFVGEAFYSFTLYPNTLNLGIILGYDLLV
jgi:hypothetical protein